MTDPLRRFSDDLEALISTYRTKPEDDRMTFADVIAALEFAKHKLMQELTGDTVLCENCRNEVASSFDEDGVGLCNRCARREQRGRP